MQLKWKQSSPYLYGHKMIKDMKLHHTYSEKDISLTLIKKKIIINSSPQEMLQFYSSGSDC